MPGIGSAIGVGWQEKALSVVQKIPTSLDKHYSSSLPAGIYGLLTGFVIMQRIGLIGGNFRDGTYQVIAV